MKTKVKVVRHREPTSVSLPKDLVKRTDELASLVKLNRSKIFEYALEAYLKGKGDKK